ncbi:MAG: OmpA family protein [Steroidobacteraceae bacterium]
MNSIAQWGSVLSVAIASFYCLSTFGDQRRAPPPEGTPAIPPSADERLHTQLAAIGATRTARGWVVTLLCTRFQSGKAQLEPTDVDKLERIAALLQVHPYLRVMIEADKDTRSTHAHNEGLSQRLANAVLCDLIESGGDAARIRARVREEDSPVGCLETAKVRQLHRRIQILFSDAEGEFNPATEKSPSGSPRRTGL